MIKNKKREGSYKGETKMKERALSIFNYLFLPLEKLVVLMKSF